MKRFCIKIGLFIFLFFILAIPTDYAISFLLAQSNSYPGEFEVQRDIYNSNANCEIAIYGSSRAWVHIDPQIISDSLGMNAYNFGIDGHNFWLQYLRHLEFIKHNKKPRIILLSVDIYSLQKRQDLYELNQFLPYMLWNKNVIDFTSSYLGFVTYEYYIPLLRFMGKKKLLNRTISEVLFNKKYLPYRKNGFKAIDEEWNKDFDNAISSATNYRCVLNDSSVSLFEKFIVECKNNKIELILVYTPEYYEIQRFVTNRSEVVGIFNEFCKKYNLLYLDYSSDTMCLDKKYFYNANHLNKTGSNLFSQKLAHDLREYKYIAEF